MAPTRMFQDDQPEAPSPRTTIVGGRPPESAGDLPPVPTGLQTLLRLAGVDPAFRTELLARRAEVASPAGIPLTRAEAAILQAVPSVQLERMIETLPPPPLDRRAFLRASAAGAVTALGGAALLGAGGCERVVRAGMVTEGGAAPDLPPEIREFAPPPPDAGQPQPPMPQPPPPRPDHGFPAPGGAAPDLPPPTPPRPLDAGLDPAPLRPLVPPAATEGGAAPSLPSPTRGIRPDLPWTE